MEFSKVMLLEAIASLSVSSQAIILITNATAYSATLGSEEITAIGNSATLFSGSAVGGGFLTSLWHHRNAVRCTKYWIPYWFH